MWFFVKYLCVSRPFASISCSMGPMIPITRASKVAGESFWKSTCADNITFGVRRGNNSRKWRMKNDNKDRWLVTRCWRKWAISAEAAGFWYGGRLKILYPVYWLGLLLEKDAKGRHCGTNCRSTTGWPFAIHEIRKGGRQWCLRQYYYVQYFVYWFISLIFWWGGTREG